MLEVQVLLLPEQFRQAKEYIMPRSAQMVFDVSVTSSHRFCNLLSISNQFQELKASN